MTSDRHCLNCDHLFHSRHMDDTRDVALSDEAQAHRCRDCLDCNPPEDATVRESTGVAVPA